MAVQSGLAKPVAAAKTNAITRLTAARHAADVRPVPQHAEVPRAWGCHSPSAHCRPVPETSGPSTASLAHLFFFKDTADPDKFLFRRQAHPPVKLGAIMSGSS